MIVVSDGEVFGAAIFIMAKLGHGTSPDTGDWRYVMILPDGSFAGDVADDTAPEVE